MAKIVGSKSLSKRGKKSSRKVYFFANICCFWLFGKPIKQKNTQVVFPYVNLRTLGVLEKTNKAQQTMINREQKQYVKFFTQYRKFFTMTLVQAIYFLRYTHFFFKVLTRTRQRKTDNGIRFPVLDFLFKFLIPEVTDHVTGSQRRLSFSLKLSFSLIMTSQ